MDKDLLSYWQSEEAAAFTGWDFSYLNGRYFEENPPWDYRQKVEAFLKPQVRLLDMGTGGGEFLLSLKHPYKLTAVTEGYEPNVEYCRKRLLPLGITVVQADGEDDLPFEDNCFDLIINRHEAYRTDELKRILKPGGFFITQQVGGSNARPLSEFLCPGFVPPLPLHNLENESKRFTAAGFRLMYQNQSYKKTTFTDIGALCYYAKQIPWEFPGFSVQAMQEKLLKLHEHCQKYGTVETVSHRFIIIAKNLKK